MEMKKAVGIWIPFATLELIMVVVVIILSSTSLKQRNLIKEMNHIIEKKEKTILNIEEEFKSEEKYKYDFIDKKMAVYIESLCNELEVNSDLVFGILMVENPEFDVNAVNRNINNTVDCGLFQLNDRYIWTDFKNNYWINDVELDPFNWKHNCYLAIHHIKYLQDKLKIQNEVIMAYNCGLNAVINDNIPSATKVYLAKVNNNIRLLNGYKYEENKE